MKKYLSEALLITCTNNIFMLDHWLKWHKNIIKFDHIIVVDNNSTCNLKLICDRYDNVTYYKRPEKISQSETYNEFVNNSDAYWSMPIDDDEFLYISDKYNNSINELLKVYSTKHPDFLKFSFTWAMMFADKLIQERDLSSPVFNDFLYTYTNKEFFEHIINVKTINNTLVKHYYVKDTYKVNRIKYEDIDLPPERLIYEKVKGWKDLIDYDHLGTVHNPITKLFDTYIHSYNISDGFLTPGYLAHKELDIECDAFLAHYKFRTVNEWEYKIHNRNKYNDLYHDYDDHYTNNQLLEAYDTKYTNKFIKNNKLQILWNKYQNE